jgi:FecR protein
MTKYLPQEESLSLLRTTPIGVSTPNEEAAERARLLPWLEQEIAALPLQRARKLQTRRRVATALSCLSLAAGAVIAISVRRTPQALPASLDSQVYATLLEGRVESGTLQLLPGSHLGIESRIRTHVDAGARLVTNGGVTLTAEANTRLALLPEREANGEHTALVEVSSGEVEFAVPKQAAGNRFQVITADAEVTVVGTRFVVSVGSTTCVRVGEGSVAVRRASGVVLLHAGNRSGCDEERPLLNDEVGQLAQPSSASVSSVNTPSPGTPLSPAAQKVEAPRAASTLVVQNRLLATALAAERHGDWARARASFRQLIDQYPGSAFVPEAHAGLERLRGR